MSSAPSDKFLAHLQYFEQNIAQMEDKVNRLENELQNGWKEENFEFGEK